MAIMDLRSQTAETIDLIATCEINNITARYVGFNRILNEYKRLRLTPDAELVNCIELLADAISNH